MKTIIEKQILEWKEELARQVQTKSQAEKVLADTNKNILMIEGGIQAKEMLLKKIESASHTPIKVDEEPQTKQKPSK